MSWHFDGSETDRDAIKQIAYKLDPECWDSYSGKPAAFKRKLEARRVASLEAAQAKYVPLPTRLDGAAMGDNTPTPGPWRWFGFYLLQDVPSRGGEGQETNPYSTPCGYPIACDGSSGGEYNPTIDTNGPDARLIAAAPDLYSALCSIVLEHDAGGITLAAMKEARAAVAKAVDIRFQP